jgi:hypothetical protein
MTPNSLVVDTDISETSFSHSFSDQEERATSIFTFDREVEGSIYPETLISNYMTTWSHNSKCPILNLYAIRWGTLLQLINRNKCGLLKRFRNALVDNYLCARRMGTTGYGSEQRKFMPIGL